YFHGLRVYAGDSVGTELAEEGDAAGIDRYAVRLGIGCRRAFQDDLSGRGVQPAYEIGLLHGEPECPLSIEYRRMRIAGVLVRQGILVTVPLFGSSLPIYPL